MIPLVMDLLVPWMMRRTLIQHKKWVTMVEPGSVSYEKKVNKLIQSTVEVLASDDMKELLYLPKLLNMS